MDSKELFSYSGMLHYWEAEDLRNYFLSTLEAIFKDKIERIRLYKDGKLITDTSPPLDKTEEFNLKFDILTKKSVTNIPEMDFLNFYGWISILNDITSRQKFSGNPNITFLPYENDHKTMVLSFSLKYNNSKNEE